MIEAALVAWRFRHWRAPGAAGQRALTYRLATYWLARHPRLGRLADPANETTYDGPGPCKQPLQRRAAGAAERVQRGRSAADFGDSLLGSL